jgi:EAL and modified HD-GYP domain-containing signal transduction protein
MEISVICAAPTSVCLARQPIYAANREIRGYELLYRGNPADTSAHIRNADQASAEVLLQAFLEIGLPASSKDRPVFINHTQHLLMMDPILPPDRCVIEVLEDVPAEPETLAALRRLRQLHYRIALDDFVFSEPLVPMLELADFVKLDLRALGREGFHEQLQLLRPFPVRIIAEKIESEAEFRWCREQGSELFQGYYLRRPEIVLGRHVPSNRLSVLSLLAECSDTENSACAIAGIISRDAPLTYGLLRLCNSALYARRRGIRSPVQAVTFLGMDFVFRWASLLALSGGNDCPSGYLETALQRARMCELIAAPCQCTAQAAYITGLLSALDFVFDAPIEELVGPLPIDSRFKRAILHREGALGGVLDSVTAYEAGEWRNEPGTSAEFMQRSFWDAAEYARTMISQMGTG